MNASEQNAFLGICLLCCARGVLTFEAIVSRPQTCPSELKRFVAGFASHYLEFGILLIDSERVK